MPAEGDSRKDFARGFIDSKTITDGVRPEGKDDDLFWGRFVAFDVGVKGDLLGAKRWVVVKSWVGGWGGCVENLVLRFWSAIRRKAVGRGIGGVDLGGRVNGRRRDEGRFLFGGLVSHGDVRCHAAGGI